MSILIALIGQEEQMASQVCARPNGSTSFEGGLDRKSPTRCIGGSVEFASRHGDHSRDFGGGTGRVLELGPGTGVLN